MEGIQNPIPRTVEEVFSDFRGRRAGLIKALSTGELDLFLSLSLESLFLLFESKANMLLRVLSMSTVCGMFCIDLRVFMFV